MAKGTNLRTETIQLAPDFVIGVVLASSVPQAFDTPAGMGYASFSFDSDVFVKYGSTATGYPTSSSTAGTTFGERIPGAAASPVLRNIVSTAACTGISIVAAALAGTRGSISWYKPS